MRENEIRDVAWSAAQVAVESIDFLSVAEEADALGVELTEDELRQAHNLATHAGVVMPGD